MTVLLLLAIGLLIGAVLGLTGAGGSVIAVPLLLVLLNLDPVSATGLALGVVAVSSLYGSVQRIRQREILWIPAILFGVSGAIFAPMGRLLATQVSPQALTAGFSALSLLIALRMLWQSIHDPQNSAVIRAGGGGFMIVPFLNQLNSVSMRSAVATSLVIIAAISASGFAAHIAMYSTDWHQLLYLSIGGVGGMLLGSLLARWLAGVYLQRLFAISILAMAALILVR